MQGTYIISAAFYLTCVILPIKNCRLLFSLVGLCYHPVLHISGHRTVYLFCININSCLGLISVPDSLVWPVLHLPYLVCISDLAYLEPRYSSFTYLRCIYKDIFYSNVGVKDSLGHSKNDVCVIYITSAVEQIHIGL